MTAPHLPSALPLLAGLVLYCPKPRLTNYDSSWCNLEVLTPFSCSALFSADFTLVSLSIFSSQFKCKCWRSLCALCSIPSCQVHCPGETGIDILFSTWECALECHSPEMRASSVMDTDVLLFAGSDPRPSGLPLNATANPHCSKIYLFNRLVVPPLGLRWYRSGVLAFPIPSRQFSDCCRSCKQPTPRTKCFVWSLCSGILTIDMFRMG